MADKDEQLPRRAFFREGLRRMIRPLVDSVAPLGQAAERLARLAEQASLPGNPPAAGEIQPNNPATSTGAKQGADEGIHSILPPASIQPTGTILPPEQQVRESPGKSESSTQGESPALDDPSTRDHPSMRDELSKPASTRATGINSITLSASQASPGTKAVMHVAARLPVAGSIARSAGRRLHWVRPPGAMREDLFRLACSQCGVCVKACPANAIQLDPTGQRGDGLPFIIPSEAPCVVCDGLHCMHECPSGALSVLAMADIRMGIAIWNEDLCTRTRVGTASRSDSPMISTPEVDAPRSDSAGAPVQDDACTLCVEVCPVGSAAIEVRGLAIQVHEAGCIGCGLCESSCPTHPRAVVIQPISAKVSSQGR